MNAIRLLRATGLSIKQIADAVGVVPHAISGYANSRRFPSQTNYVALVELARTRNISLRADDFLPETDHRQAA